MKRERQSDPNHVSVELREPGSFDVRDLKSVVIVVALLMLFLSASGFLLSLSFALRGYVDFRSFYTAGFMVRTGHSSEIYDYAQTHKFQNERVGPAEIALPFNHLAYESLIDVLFSFFTYRGAYIAFLIFNLIILAVVVYMLRLYLTPLKDVWSYLPIAFVVCFLPVTMTLIEGQDSLILLALLVASSLELDRQNDLRAGMLTGITLFKYQYALPIAFLFFIWRRWRFLAGFVLSGAVVIGISVWLIGYSGVLSYIHYLPGASSRFSAANDALYGIHPEGMPNLRGLVYMVSGGAVSLTNLITAALSCIALAWAAPRRPSMPWAVLTALVVSYHQMISDTSLLLLPLAVIVCRLMKGGVLGAWIGTFAALAFVGPTLLLFAGTRFYLLVLPILGLFVLAPGLEPSPVRWPIAGTAVHKR
jgi:hypothetical protein